MTGRFEQIFGPGAKPLIAMAHLGPLPGTPLYDEALGVQGIVDGVARDLDVLLQFPFDAVMFCNEGDRPYSLRAGFEGVAVMARVAADLAPGTGRSAWTSSGTAGPRCRCSGDRRGRTGRCQHARGGKRDRALPDDDDFWHRRQPGCRRRGGGGSRAPASRGAG